MARLEEHLDLARDAALGKQPVRVIAPWTTLQPGGERVDELQSKARRHLDGTERFSSKDIADALARLILGG